MMSKEELNNINVDLWLIGHTHVPYPRSLSQEFEVINNKIFNAGSHMQNDINENSEGQCFIIELNNDKSIRAKKFLSGPVSFKKLDINFNGESLDNKLADKLAGFKDNCVIELNLTGFINRRDFENRANIIDLELERFIDHEIDYRGLAPIVDEEILNEFADNSFSRKFLSNVLSELGNEEAYMAYSLIKNLKN